MHPATPTFITEVFIFLLMYSHFKLLLKWINSLYGASLHLLGWFSQCASMLRPYLRTNDTDYSCYIKAVELVWPTIWVYITPLVINSLRGGHTHRHTDTHTHIHTRVRTKAILRNQVCASFWLARAWFNKVKSYYRTKLNSRHLLSLFY